MKEIENLLDLKFQEQSNTYILGNEPHIYHCHHYNCFMLLSFETVSSYIAINEILINSAAEVIYNVMSSLYSEHNINSITERKEIAERYFSKRGFGILQLSSITENGGTAICPYEHYSIAWLDKFGSRANVEDGVAYFATGFIAGALDAIYSCTNGTFLAEQTHCVSKKDKECVFKVSKRSTPLQLEPSPQKGYSQSGFELLTPEGSNLNYKTIQQAVLTMPFDADERGLIECFGVYLTQMPANFYNLISYRLLFQLEELIGSAAKELSEDLLKEAGHVCSFNTYGGIMESAEWEALLLPLIKNQEDWIHGLFGIINAFGWGFYQLKELVKGEKLVIRIDNGYEANFFLKKYGKIKSNISYLATGGAAGIMNLIYNAEIQKSPVLSEEFYEEIFKSENRFFSTQTKCRANGDEYDEITVTKANSK